VRGRSEHHRDQQRHRPAGRCCGCSPTTGR
jgi:hypothetical protein